VHKFTTVFIVVKQN